MQTSMSNSKTRYFLIEIIINCLIFAISAAVCLALFVNGFIESRDSRALSVAVLESQSVAETIKATSGDTEKLAELLGTSPDGETLKLHYDSDWARTDAPNIAYTLTVTQDMTDNMLTATVQVTDENGTLIYSLDVVKYLGGTGGGSDAGA